MIPEEVRATVAAQCAVDITRLNGLLEGPVRRQRTLLDAPQFDYDLRPFLMPAQPGETDDFVLAPTPADAGPFSHLLLELLARQ